MCNLTLFCLSSVELRLDKGCWIKKCREVAVEEHGGEVRQRLLDKEV